MKPVTHLLVTPCSSDPALLFSISFIKLVHERFVYLFIVPLFQLECKLHRDWDFLYLIHCGVLNTYNNK